MLQPILKLTKQLVAVPSVAGNDKALEKVLKLALVPLKDYTVEMFERKGAKSALVYAGKKRPKKFKVLLNAHLDVIPGKQYKPIIKGDKLYGTGSMDMKGNAASLIFAFKEVANKVNYPLGLQLVTDEEIGGFDGTKYQVEKGVQADFVIGSEPTNFDISTKAKGILWVKISAIGKTYHSAYPWKGENAIIKMNEFLTRLTEKYANPKEPAWVTTVNVATVNTGNAAFNKIPDDCVVGLDIRYIPEDAKKMVSDLKGLLPSGFSLEVLVNEPSRFTEETDAYVVSLQKIAEKNLGKPIVVRGAHGSSDLRHFTCPGVEFGPIGGGIGSDEEWVDMPSLETYCHIIKDFLLSLK